MQTKSEFKNESNQDYQALLIKLGVPKDLLSLSNLDFALLYQRLRFAMSGNYSNSPLQCTASWQLQILGDSTFDYEILKREGTLRDNRGATSLHYTAWSGKPEALTWIKANFPEALTLEDNFGVTPIHYAAWSGNPEALIWLKANFPEALTLKNKYGQTPIHYATMSGDPEALTWIKANLPEAWTLKNNIGATPIHYAAWSGNPEALIWLKANFPEALTFKDNNGRTLIFYAAWAGNPEALTWIKTNLPEALTLKDNDGRTPTHYAAYSGNPEALTWIKANFPEALTLKDKYGRTLIFYAAWSGNPEALNQALSKNNSFESFNDSSVKDQNIITGTLIKALETNYHLTYISSLDRCEMNEEEKISITMSLSRNLAIKRANVGFIAFLQGINQKESKASWLLGCGLEIFELILKHILPEGVDTPRVFKENYRKIDYKARAIAHKDEALERIQSEISRLIPFNNENNIFLGFSLDCVRLNSDPKIEALKGLANIIKEGGTDRLSQIEEWKKMYSPTLATHRNLGSQFFAPGPTKTEVAVKAILNLLENQHLPDVEFKI